MTPEQYLAEAQTHLEAGRFVEATAYASMATAAATVMPQQPAVLPVYRGEHRAGRPWCGKCFSSKWRFTRKAGDVARPCSCHPGRLEEVRQCRYCQVPLKRDPDSKKWIAANKAAVCPKAPDLTDPSAVPLEPDLNKDDEWAEFLQHVSMFGTSSDKRIWTSDELLQQREEYAASMPVTQYGELPHPRQMDAWLFDRAGRPHGKYRVTQVLEDEGVPAWRASPI
ncbi:hypothetical protein OH736_45440 (plasmid) [Streptomyces sp. NBC_01650]|uniref:hypothetical protein n=1 Tax=Streptomyces sp. NBC_01650 TaxID=2975907 RepID=UPI002F90B148|nr:hypothetical protein OH736_45440 [Streptomyces sp. NBC_01650]